MKNRIIALSAAAALSLGVGGVATIAPSFAADAHVAVAQAGSLPRLHTGSTGAGVKVLQRLLNAEGAKVAVDGSFGPATDAALRAYQKKNGLAADGYAGPATWSKLLPVLKSGSQGGAVKALQQSLGDHGAKLAADGSFGPATKSAVTAFQSSKRLAADGVVGPATWGALLGATATAPTPPPTTPAPKSGTWVVMDQLQTGEGGGDSCGPTSVAMVLVGTGRTLPGYGGPNSYAAAVANLRTVSGTQAGVGTGAAGMQRALEKYGAKDQRTQDMGAALAAVRSGKPVILNGYSGALPWLGGHTGHYIVVKGYDAKTGQYQVLDPWKGREKTASAQVLTDFGTSKGDPRGGDWREHHIVS